MKDRPRDFAGIVGGHWPKATGYLQASRQPCIQIRDDEVGHIGSNRKLVALQPGELHAIDQDRIWILGVILCPKDDITEIAKWAKLHGIDPGHIWFFLHTSTDMDVLRPWLDAGFRTDQVDIIEDWEDLHPVFGLQLADYIYEARGPPHARTWTPGRKAKR